MSKAAELLCRLTSTVNLQDQWLTPDDSVIAMVRASATQMKERAELLAGKRGQLHDGETFFTIDGLTVAVSSSFSSDFSYVAVSPL